MIIQVIRRQYLYFNLIVSLSNAPHLSLGSAEALLRRPAHMQLVPQMMTAACCAAVKMVHGVAHLAGIRLLSGKLNAVSKLARGGRIIHLLQLLVVIFVQE